MWLLMWHRVRQVKDDSPKSPVEYSNKTADGYSDLNAPDVGILHNKQLKSQEY